MPLFVSEETRWIETPHGRLFSRRWSPADERAETAQPPIILFHDSLGCVVLWRDFPEQLCQATGRIVVAYDRLGFGQSDAYPGDLPTRFIRDEAECFFPLLRQQWQIDRFVAFGHSVGGAMAATCAALYPHSCQSLITESAQAFVEDRTLNGIRIAKAQFKEAGQMERLHKYHGDKAAWVLSAWTETWLSKAFEQWTLESSAASIQCPLLALHGENDEYGSVLHPQRIAMLGTASSTSVILKNRHHVPHREAPNEVLDVVKQHLESNAG
jgi:pimeloyl-ACP methyl ester carboxylesterase